VHKHKYVCYRVGVSLPAVDLYLPVEFENFEALALWIGVDLFFWRANPGIRIRLVGRCRSWWSTMLGTATGVPVPVRYTEKRTLPCE
jgi:hypothetical protein